MHLSTQSAKSTTFLWVAALSFGFISVIHAYTSGFRGADKTLITAAVATLTFEIIRLPVAWVATGVLGSLRLWIACPVSNLLGALIA